MTVTGSQQHDGGGIWAAGWLCQPLAWVWRSGVACIVLAAFLFSCGTLSVRLLESASKEPDGPPSVPPFEVAFIPATISWIILSGWMSRLPAGSIHFLSSSKEVCLLTILRAAFGATSLALLYIALEMLPLQTAVAIFFCNPVMAAMLEWMVRGDNLTKGSIAGCILTVVGVFLVTQPHRAAEQPVDILTGHSSTGISIALLSAAFNAVAFVLVRQLGRKQSALTLTWWYHLVLMILSAVVMATKRSMAPVPLTHEQASLMAAVCGAQFSGQILMNRGFQLVSATRGSAINVLQVLFSYVFAVVILGDPISVMGASGGACVMMGVISIALSGITCTAAKPQPAAPDTTADDSDTTYLLIRSSEDGVDARRQRESRTSYGGHDDGVGRRGPQQTGARTMFPGMLLHDSHGVMAGGAWIASLAGSAADAADAVEEGSTAVQPETAVIPQRNGGGSSSAALPPLSGVQPSPPSLPPGGIGAVVHPGLPRATSRARRLDHVHADDAVPIEQHPHSNSSTDLVSHHSMPHLQGVEHAAIATETISQARLSSASSVSSHIGSGRSSWDLTHTERQGSFSSQRSMHSMHSTQSMTGTSRSDLLRHLLSGKRRSSCSECEMEQQLSQDGAT